MHNQADLNSKMRSILVDWLVEVHHKFKLYTSSLYLCVNILDRFLSKVSILRARLQLVGISAFFLACKFEEVYPPGANDFVHITDNAYTKKEMLTMESDILAALNYEILVPTAHTFLSRYLNAIRASDSIRHLANYYAERNLQEAHMLEVKPRVYAGAALYAALKQQNMRYASKLHSSPVWTTILQDESNLSEADLLPCARLMIKHAREEPITTSKRKLIAAKRKYTQEKFQAVALLDLPSF
jgi:G2/mitotic-specific cyclin-B, other